MKFTKHKDEEGVGGTWWQVWEAEKDANGNWINRECVATFLEETHADKFINLMTNVLLKVEITLFSRSVSNEKTGIQFLG